MNNAGILQTIEAGNIISGPFVADGQWHHVVGVEDNSAVDGLKRKLYLDGRVVGSDTTMFTITLAGANKFAIGNNGNSPASAPYQGIIDSVFVCDFAMPFETVAKLYTKGAQDLGASPKNSGDHVERMDATSILAIFDSIDMQNTVDMVIA
jgi:hypothetical protein